MSGYTTITLEINDSGHPIGWGGPPDEVSQINADLLAAAKVALDELEGRSRSCYINEICRVEKAIAQLTNAISAAEGGRDANPQ